jgi:hypothetical protein
MTTAPSTSAKRYLFVGTGRDGTQSLTEMVRELFEREGAGRTVMHEYACREFYDAFAAAQAGEGRDRIRELIESCPYDAIVGNGYAAVLPAFAEIWGGETVLVHVRRADRAACIRSLVENCTYFPSAYGNYSTSPAAETDRMAAFHFAEMSRPAWGALPLAEKLGWYYDKTHALIDAHAPRFAQVWSVETEQLNGAATRGRLAEILGLAALGPPQASHLNTHVAMAHVPTESREKIQWLLRRFDVARAATDDLYPASFFLNALIAWTGYQLNDDVRLGAADHRTDAELADLLARARELLDEHRRYVDLLELQRTMNAEAAAGEDPA